MEKEDHELLDSIITRLGSVFITVNKELEDVALTVVSCIKDLEKMNEVTTINETASTVKSEAFANKHREFCMNIGKQFEEKDLEYLIHIARHDDKSSITFGHMTDKLMIKSISGAMIMSQLIFEGVLKEIGMPPQCIDCVPSPKERQENTTAGVAIFGNMPPEIKKKIESAMTKVLDSLGPGSHSDEEIKAKIESLMGGIAVRIPSNNLLTKDFGWDRDKNEEPDDQNP